jgi:hypothetical protein
MEVLVGSPRLVVATPATLPVLVTAWLDIVKGVIVVIEPANVEACVGDDRGVCGRVEVDRQRPR